MRKRVQVMKERVRLAKEEFELIGAKKKYIVKRKEKAQRRIEGARRRHPSSVERDRMVAKLGDLQYQEMLLDQDMESAKESEFGAQQVLNILKAELHYLELLNEWIFANNIKACSSSKLGFSPYKCITFS